MNNSSPPRIESLHIRNYRALRDLRLEKLTPLTVFLGPNGSGKSTVFDALAFLSECFNDGLRKAWDQRGRFQELRTRGSDEPIVIEFSYHRSKDDKSLIHYYIEIDERDNHPFVSREIVYLQINLDTERKKILDYEKGVGWHITEEQDERGDYFHDSFGSDDTIAVNLLGQFVKSPRLIDLRKFIASWHISEFQSDKKLYGIVKAQVQEQLSSSGDNLTNVIQYLETTHPEVWNRVVTRMTRYVPQLERVQTEQIQNSLQLLTKDIAFGQPIQARYASDGTLKLLAYLVLLNQPDPYSLVAVEEPENYLHPRLMQRLAEECRMATARTQLMVATHSPNFVAGLYPDEVWMLYRDETGYTQAQRAADNSLLMAMVESGGSLGSLWMEGYFRVGDPLYSNGRGLRSK